MIARILVRRVAALVEDDRWLPGSYFVALQIRPAQRRANNTIPIGCDSEWP